MHNHSTPRGETHIGTLLLSLPSTYTGGALVVRQNGSEVFFDWSHSISLEWAFLYSDCEHEVLPVTSGHRITIQYNVYDTPSELMTADPLVQADSRLDFFKSAIDTLLDANEALTLGFALRHEYPRDRHSSGHLDDLKERLKGYDRVLLRLIEAKGLSWEFRVVWKISDEDWRERDVDHVTESDEFRAAEAQLKAADPKGSESWSDEYRRAYRKMEARSIADYLARHNSRWALPFRHRCFTSEDYRTVDGTYMEQSLWSYLEESSRAQARDDILWISKPQRYDDQVTYTTYGNEADTAYTAKWLKGIE
jgi:predicted secreted protein